MLVTAHEPRRPLLKEINKMALYPTETLLWDETQLPVSDYTTDTVLALPKLNLQVNMWSGLVDSAGPVVTVGVVFVCGRCALSS